MDAPREMTDKEIKAVAKVERALAAVPDTIGLHFNESGICVIDSQEWAEGVLDAEGVARRAMDGVPGRIGCRYDSGAL